MRRVSCVLILIVAVPLMVVAQCDGNAHTGTYYVDNSCSTNGNGSTTTCGATGPFNSIANMQAKSGGYAAGSYICLKRGQTYRETFTLPSSGTSTSHIVLSAYGSGNKPILKGSDPLTSWTRISGNTFQTAAPSNIDFVWKDGVFQKPGSSASTLNNHEFFWTGGILYYREDESDLGSHVIEGSVRSSGIYGSSKSYWDINNIRIMHDDASAYGYGFRFEGGTGFNLTDAEVVEARAFSAASTASIVVNRCIFNGSHGGSYWPQFWADGSTSVTVYNTIFRGSEDGQPSFQLTGSATGNIYNSLFDQYGGNAILSTSSGVLNIQNSIFTGGVSGWGNETMVRTGTGAVNVDYSLILPYGRDGRLFLKGINEGSHNLYVAPNFKSSVAKGYLIIGADDTGWYKYFDEATRTADQYGYKIGFATDAADLNNIPEAVTYLQDAINRGHWIASHSNSHADLSVLTGLTIQYAGAGTAATMTIASNHLITQVAGAAADNLNLDLTVNPYDTLAHLCDYLSGSTGGKYSCSGTDYSNVYTAAANLADVPQQDIKTAGYAAVLDQNRYYNFEINGAHNIITSKFKNQDGTPYSLDTFVYPFGMTVPDSAVARLQSLHYLGARSTLDWLAYPGWRTSVGIDLYSMLTSTGMSSLGELVYLWYDNTCADLSENAKNFTCSSITYSATVVPEMSLYGAHSAVFNGTSSHAQRLDASFDFHRGDGYWSAMIRPTSLTKKQALFFQGTDVNNYHTLYLSTTGTIVYSIVAAGTETVHVETASGLLSTTAWKRVTLMFNRNTYKIFVGAPEVASVFSTNRPAIYTGGYFRIGAGGVTTLQDYYGGYMAAMSFGTNAFASTTAFLDTLSSQGGVLFLYGHGDSGLPVPILREIFQAKQASSANVMLDTYHNVLADLRANGTLGADNRTLTWLQPDQSDYHLLSTSDLINMGWSIGAPGTDMDGNPRSGPTDIGIFEFITTTRRSRSYWW